MLNQVTLVGRVAQEIKKERTSNDIDVSTIVVVTNGRKDEEPQFHNVTTFGKLALACAEYLRVGQQVVVTGRLNYRKWTDDRYRDADGNPLNRLQTIIIARTVQFGAKSKKSANGADAPVENTPCDDDLPF